MKARNSTAPKSVLFVRSDAYGDLVLFAPALAALKEAWPETKIGMVIKARYLDIRHLLPEGLVLLATDLDPNTESAPDGPRRDSLTQLIREFSPEILVAPCYEKTWIHRFAAEAAREARRVSLGPAIFDTTPCATEGSQTDGPASFVAYPETIHIEKEVHELEKSRTLVSYLTRSRTPTLLPAIRVPESARRSAMSILEGLELSKKSYIICNPAGIGNVPIKAWSTAKYAALIGFIVNRHRLPVLLCLHESERSVSEEILRSLNGESQIKVWLGSNGDVPIVAALCEAARAFLGNDTSTAHLAEATGTPSFVICGGGHWPRFKPSLPVSHALLHPLPCFGCGWDCHYGAALCVGLIETSDAIDAFDRFLAIPNGATGGSQLTELRRISPEFIEAIQNSRDKYEVIQRDRIARYSQIQTLTREVKHFERLLGEASSKAAGLRPANSASVAGNAEFASKNEGIAEKLKFAELEIEGLLKQSRELTDLSSTVEKDAIRLHAHVADLNEIAREKSAQVEQLAIERDALNKIAKEKSTRVEQLAKERDILDNIAREKAARIQELDQERNALNTIAREMSSQVEILRKELDARAHHAATQYSEIETLLRNADQRRREHDGTKALMQGSIDALNTTVANLVDANQLLESKVEGLRSGMDILRTEIGKAESDLAEKSERLALTLTAYETTGQMLTSLIAHRWTRIGRTLGIFGSTLPKDFDYGAAVGLESTRHAEKAAKDSTDATERLDLAAREVQKYREENVRLAKEIDLQRSVNASLLKETDNLPLGEAPRSKVLPARPSSAETVIFALDRVETVNGHFLISGWAFCHAIDCKQATIWIWLKSNIEQRLVSVLPVKRPDVKVHFESLKPGSSMKEEDPCWASLECSGFMANFALSDLLAGCQYSVEIQIDGPNFSARCPTHATIDT